MSVKRKFVNYFLLLIFFSAVEAAKNSHEIDNTKIPEAVINNDPVRHQRAPKVSVPRCRTSQYFNKEEGRCMRVPGGGKVVNINYGQSCGTELLKPHCPNARYYFMCQGNNTITVQCAKGQLFDNRLQKCVLTGIRNPKPIFLHSQDENLKHVQPPACKKHGRFPVPGYCNLFYTCDTNGYRFYQNVFKCPTNATYNAAQGICIFSSTAEFCLKNTPQTCVPLTPNSLSTTETNEIVTTESTLQQTEKGEDLPVKGRDDLETEAATTPRYFDIVDTTIEQFFVGASNPLTNMEHLYSGVSDNYPETTTSASYSSEDISSTSFGDLAFSPSTETSFEVTPKTTSNNDEETLEDLNSTTPQNLETSTAPLQAKSDAEYTTASLILDSTTDIPDTVFESTTTDDFSVMTDASTVTADMNAELNFTPDGEFTTEESTESDKITANFLSTASTIIEETTPDNTQEVITTTESEYSETTSQYTDSLTIYTTAASTITQDDLGVTPETFTDYKENESSTTPRTDLNSARSELLTEYPEYLSSSTFEPENSNDNATESVSYLPSAEISESGTSFPSTKSYPDELASQTNQTVTDKSPAINVTPLSEGASRTNKNDGHQTFVTEAQPFDVEPTGSARTYLPITAAITNISHMLEESMLRLFHGFARRLEQ